MKCFICCMSFCSIKWRTAVFLNVNFFFIKIFGWNSEAFFCSLTGFNFYNLCIGLKKESKENHVFLIPIPNLFSVEKRKYL